MALHEFEKEELQESIDQMNIEKIALLGLANAGKTSIIRTILYQFEDLMGLTPTKSIDRTSITFLGREIIVWDFGGQDRFIRNYFRTPEKYFQAIEYLYFVIDMQDESVFVESISYFLKALKYIAEYNPKATNVIFFHKFDPDYHGKLDFQRKKKEFFEKITPFLTDKNISIPLYYETTIYNPLTVISAFSRPLLSNENLYLTISKSLEQLCEDADINYGILFTKQFLDLGKFCDPSYVKQVTRSVKEFMKEWDVDGFTGKFPELGLGLNLIHTEKFELQFTHKTIPLYLFVGLSNLLTEEHKEKKIQKIKQYSKQLRKILIHAEMLNEKISLK